MRIGAKITTTSYERRYQQAVGDLIFHSYQLHTHLDWFEAIDWLHRFEVPARLAWQDDQLAGVMAISHPLNGAAWLRLVAINEIASTQTVMTALWQSLIPEIRQLPATSLSVLISRNWIKKYLRPLNFYFVEDVVTMERHHRARPPQIMPGSTRIRPIQADDLSAITALDQAAFSTPWQMTHNEIRAAQRMAAQATVAELHNQIVGYQISTIYDDGAHLARLAVDPTFQGRGVGSTLLHDLLAYFSHRNVQSVTVNTQASNIRSQQLYRRFGFRRNGYDLPVWMLDLTS